MASSRGYWLAGWRDTRPNEHVEVVADVEFFEQRLQQPSRLHKAPGAFG